MLTALPMTKLARPRPNKSFAGIGDIKISFCLRARTDGRAKQNPARPVLGRAGGSNVRWESGIFAKSTVVIAGLDPAIHRDEKLIA
ncbi:hypothetical protein AAFG13_20440 [Bradyrhizobium sp. B124]|uniref:hypothetical protein n=1 Tax=Bradyrhizobium sp. B124 TaxID=3140245 RepID=UPI0031845766